MRAVLISVAALTASVSAAAGQDVADRCFELALGDPFWRASETVPTPSDDPPTAISIRRGTMTRLRIEGDGDGESPPADIIVDLDTDEPFGSSSWRRVQDELRIWWGPAWYDRTFGDFRRRENGSWTGYLLRQTDVRILPDPGEWRFQAELSPIECPAGRVPPSPPSVFTYTDTVSAVIATLESVVRRLPARGLTYPIH